MNTVFSTADMFIVGTLFTLVVISIGAYLTMWKEVQLLRFTVSALHEDLKKLQRGFEKWWNKGC